MRSGERSILGALAIVVLPLIGLWLLVSWVWRKCIARRQWVSEKVVRR